MCFDTQKLIVFKFLFYFSNHDEDELPEQNEELASDRESGTVPMDVMADDKLTESSKNAIHLKSMLEEKTIELQEMSMERQQLINLSNKLKADLQRAESKVMYENEDSNQNINGNDKISCQQKQSDFEFDSIHQSNNKETYQHSKYDLSKNSITAEGKNYEGSCVDTV